jgi:hypothetical protein
MITRVARLQDAGSAVKWQFGVSSLLWLMATIGMCLAFARPFGNDAVALVLVAPVFAVIVGLALSRPGVRQQAVYWAVVCSALGSICVIPVRLDHVIFVFWPVVGAVAGAYSGARLPRVTAGTLCVAVLFGSLFIAINFLPDFPRHEFLLDLAGAPMVCVGLAVLIRTIEWLRVRYHTPREIWAAGLVFAVIAGQLAAAAVSGGRFQ